MGKWELTMNPVQEWGEEFEDGAVYGITLRREPAPPSAPQTDDANPSCAFVQYRTCKVRRLKAATLELLVNHLLDPSYQEQDYSTIFLSTYRTFTGSSKLIELLFQRDSAASDLDNCECYRSPLLAFIQTWLDEFSEDFRDPPRHSALRLLLDHLSISSAVLDNMRSQPNFCSLAGQAEALLKSFQREEPETDVGSALADLDQEAEGSGDDEDSGCENSLDPGGIMDFSAAAVAEQLTRMDSALFVRVVPYQCLGCVWSQRDKKENMSPTIRATISQFNAVTSQVIMSLLCQPTDATSSPTSSCLPPTTPALRARIIEKWIRVAQECRRLKNFSSLRAILSALQSNAVYRLRKTWAAVSRESMATFNNLWETFPDENCVLTNRELLVEDGGQASVDNISPKISKRCPISRQMSTSSGVVPYLGTYLTVLTMLDTALPDTVQSGLINLEKRRREFEVLSQIRVLQASCSQDNLPHHPRVAAWLQGHRLLTDQESYEVSRQLEPPVDVCSPTLWSHRTLSKKLSSLLTVSDGSKKVPADQISVSSSGSSGSEMEDLSSPNSACSIRLQSFHSSCNNVSEPFSLSSSASCSPCSSAASSPDSPTPSSSPCDCRADPHPPASSCGGGARPKSSLASHHKRSVSMTSLPVYNRQVADTCIVRVSVDLSKSNGNMYKSILLTSQDKTAHVIQRALEKHHLEHMSWKEFTLTQVISQDRELLIPDKANVFYAMSTTANFDFVLRQFPKGQKKPLRATSSLGRYTK
ncbi:ral guanine nucleotide dissociation stimulator-like [Hippoglossus hippoglossus]|uniref:ral guanine nucleotide dissociation stimulator-like n=1 Tax=Hippoglossus hippoglossus TaxID=8267 RepID=UPI00148DDE28|nr:ral guanine nucleotide dissociation stimulator-like [Hippoglossus hippoglossus]XP_035037530.2 ral guanine nucleotide dissociation stimulator-like isoform X1 [Hippoglossus stenolepis]